MPYNIVLSSTQSFTAGAAIPTIEWQFDQPNPLIINHFAGTAQPANINIATVIKNYLNPGVQLDIATAEQLIDNEFTNIYVKVEVERPIINKQEKNWLTVSGAIAAAIAPGYEILPNNLEVTTTLELQSFNSMLYGSTETKIHFVVLGKLATTQLIEIEKHTFSVVLNILSQTQLKASKEEINFYQVIDEAIAPNTTFDITSFGPYVVQVPSYISLTGITFVETLNGYTTYNGSGNTTITIVLNASALELEENTYSDLIVIQTTTGATETISLTTFLVPAPPPLVVVPTELSWLIIQQLPFSSQTISVSGLGNTTLVISATPSWLSVEIQQLLNVAHVILAPISSAFLSPGTYTATLVFTSGTRTQNVLITVTVIARVNLGLNKYGINFTDDFKTITSFHYSSAFNVNLNLNTNISSYFPYVFNSQNLEYLFGIHNFYAEFFIGKVIKNLMTKLNDLNQIGFTHLPLGSASIGISTNVLPLYKYMYQPATVNVQANFINRISGNTMFTDDFNNVKFIKGRRPPRFLSYAGFLQNSIQIAILDFYEKPTRVTINSVKLFNFYANTAIRISTYVNGVFNKTFNFSPQSHRIFHYVNYFSSYAEGDVIELRMFRVGLTTLEQPIISQKYIVFPEGIESYHIAWVNEYELLETMEFTGSFTFKCSLENKNINTYKKFLEQLQKLEVKQGQKLTCNTGVLLKEDARRIADLMRSKQAFLMSRDEAIAPINLIPVNKEIENNDTDRDLYSYEVEFEINLPNDSEIYPR